MIVNSYHQEAERVEALVKLRAMADRGAECASSAIRGLLQSSQQKQPPREVEYHADRVAATRGDRRSRKRKRLQLERERDSKGINQCSGAVLEYVSVALPAELWGELMGLGWGREHYQGGY
jgi:hypothetical protein